MQLECARQAQRQPAPAAAHALRRAPAGQEQRVADLAMSLEAPPGSVQGQPEACCPDQSEESREKAH